MERYTVIVQDGEVVDADLRPLAPAIRDDCGHQHKTEEAAERCQGRLLGYHREHGGWVCSAHWYNSTIHRHPLGSMRYPEDTAAAYCAVCLSPDVMTPDQDICQRCYEERER